MKKAKQARPSREEILEGIGYTPLTFPASLHDGRRRKEAHDEYHDWIGIRRGSLPTAVQTRSPKNRANTYSFGCWSGGSGTSGTS
jgi:hypothetical protein